MSQSLDRFVDGLFAEIESAEGAALQPESPGDRIGNYTLAEELGSGGFGVVWRAEQQKPVRREVALKIIKLGMDTREVIARFEAERQALAVLDHPGIAKVFDAGATPTGRPYFVMELVRGSPLVRHCDEHSLPLAERLALFTDVCRAVQHAHQKGIIHRDLKPSNLLVSVLDGKAAPKVIDFGIAKATGSARLTENTLLTRMDRLMGTPAYMSPEQAEPGKDLDTRTDIYSLGVVLYELLTGQVPFPIGPDGRTPRTRDAQRPSTRIRSFTVEQLRRLGEFRRVDGPKLIGLVKGDLDWIVMKALETDRERRYESADALAEDVRCFLQQQPVAARPPTTWYLLRRFTQRNKLAVGAAMAILLVLIAGITASTWMYIKEKRALTESREVSRFLKDILAQAGVSKSLGRDATMMREILDKTAERIGLELKDHPEVEAELRGVIGRTYEDIDEYELAMKQTAEEVRLRRELHRGDHAHLAEALINHASTTETTGRMREAEALGREALAMWQRLVGEDDVRTGSAHAMLAWILMKSGRSAEAEESARRAFAQWRLHPADPLLSGAPKALSAVLHNTKQHDESIAVNQEELDALRKQRGPEHPDVMNCMDNLGVELCRAGRFEEAEPLLLESLRQGEKFYKDRSPVADHAYAALARVAASRKDWEQQLKYARESMAAAARVFPVGHRYYREGCNVLAKVLVEHAERHADAATKLMDDPAKAAAEAAKTLSLVDELRGSKDFEVEAKASGAWLDCLRGQALMISADTREEGRTLITNGVGILKKKEKPAAEDKRRLAKAEKMLTGP